MPAAMSLSDAVLAPGASPAPSTSPIKWAALPGQLFDRAAGELRRRRAAERTIRELTSLNDRMLDDIGIQRGAIPAVAARSSRKATRPASRP